MRVRTSLVRIIVLIAAVFSLGLALPACGGGGDDNGGGGGGGGSDEAQVEAVAKKLAAGKDSSVCDQVTQGFLEQVSDKTGEAAKKDCEDSAGQNPPKKYSIDSVNVTGSTATAEVTVDGDTGQLKFEQEDGQWKVAGFKDLPG